MVVELKEEEEEFLKIELLGVFYFDDFIEFVIKLGKMKAKKILIDATKLENTNPSYKERHDIGNTAVIYLDQSLKYVVVWPERDINYYAISVMKKHGFNVQVFANRHSAKKWLLK